MLVLISTVWAQRTKRALTRALIGGAQPVEGWWAPVAQHTYKRKRWGSVARGPKFVILLPPPTETLADRGCAEAAGSSTGAAPASRHQHRLLHHAAVMRLCVVNGFMEDGGEY